jgi:hypothetical protein
MHVMTPPLPFLLSGRIAATTLETAKESLMSSQPDPSVADRLQPVVDSLERNIADLEKRWDNLQRLLVSEPLSVRWLKEQVSAALEAVEIHRNALRWLQETAPALDSRLLDLHAVLDRVDGELKALQQRLDRSSKLPDHAAIERGFEEMRRGEGEDVAETLARLLNTGNLDP